MSEGDSADDYVFRGPTVKRMTAEQFLDAVWFVTGTAPAKADASVHPPCEATAPEHRFVRAALVKSDELMRSLGRPNREQVVTTRSDVLTTLEALDLSNGQVFNDILARGAADLLKSMPKATADELADTIYLRALGHRTRPASWRRPASCWARRRRRRAWPTCSGWCSCSPSSN